MAPELPVIYENPRFDFATPTLKPVFDRAIRFGSVLMLEWGTLTVIEDAPRYLKYATVIIAILVLAVHESWPWLRMRNKRLYPAFMAVLILAYAGIFGYAFITEPLKPHAVAGAPTTIALPNPSPPVAAIIDRRKNLINDASAKWGIISGLHDAFKRGNLPKCEISIVRYQLPYAEVMSDDLKETLGVADWPFQERFATTQLPRGLTVKSSDRNSTVSVRCGSAITGALRNSTTWRGGTWSVGQTYFPHDGDCETCIEIDIGNDPDAN